MNYKFQLISPSNFIVKIIAALQYILKLFKMNLTSGIQNFTFIWFLVYCYIIKFWIYYNLSTYFFDVNYCTRKRFTTIMLTLKIWNLITQAADLILKIVLRYYLCLIKVCTCHKLHFGGISEKYCPYYCQMWVST